jgi:predicted nucleotidyltransferase
MTMPVAPDRHIRRIYSSLSTYPAYRRAKFAARLGFRPSRSNYNATVTTANGTIKAACTRLAMIDVGGLIVPVEAEAFRMCQWQAGAGAVSLTPAAGVLEKLLVLSYIGTMRRVDVIAKLKETDPALRAFGVAALYLFGSHARDEAGSQSDVDVFVDPASDEDFGFLPFMEAYEAIQNAFDHQVDIGYSTRTGLSPYIRKDVEREALRIF